PISYWCLHIGSPPVYVLFITLIFSFLSFFLRLVFASIQVDLSLKEFSLRVVVPIFLVVVFTLISLELLNYLFGKVYFSSNLIKLFFGSFVVSASVFVLGLSRLERSQAKALIRKKLFSFRRAHV